MCSTDMCLEGLIGSINMTVHSLDNGLFQDLYLLTLEYNDVLLTATPECSVSYL